MHPSRSQVRLLQLELNRNGLNAGRADGIMGTKTRQALQQFQTKNGINATGELDRQTMAALRGKRTAKKGASTPSAQQTQENQPQPNQQDSQPSKPE